MESQLWPSSRGGVASSVCSDLREMNDAKVANILSYLDEAVASRTQVAVPPHPDTSQAHDSYYSEGLTSTPTNYNTSVHQHNHHNQLHLPPPPPPPPLLHQDRKSTARNDFWNNNDHHNRPPRPPAAVAQLAPANSTASVASGLTSFVIGGSIEPHTGVYHGIKAKIDALQFANDELRAENEDLKTRLMGARQRETERVEKAQSTARAELDAVRKEMIDSTKRHTRATQEYQREKEKLTAAVESLTSQLRQEMSGREAEVAKLQSANAAAIAQLRSRWQAQEKAAREKWKAAEAKRIKETTLQSLEPDIVLLLNRHKAEKARMREEFENELRQRDEALAAKDAAVDETRARLSRESEAATEREQNACRERLREETARVHRQLDEAQRAARQQREDMESSFAEQKATLQREIARLQKELFALRESATTDGAALHDAVATEVARITAGSNQIVADLKEKLTREFDCREKEARAANAQYLAAREEEIRCRCEAERDAAIADAARRVEAERLRAATQSEGNDGVLRERCAQLSRENERLRVEAELGHKQMRAALDAVARGEREAAQLREAAESVEQRVRAAEERVRGEGEARLHVLDAEWQRRMRQFEIRHVEEVGALQHSLEKAALAMEAARTAAEIELKGAEQRHCAELNGINERVLVAIAAKDSTLRAQTEQISLLQEAVRQRDEHLARHRDLL